MRTENLKLRAELATISRASEATNAVLTQLSRNQAELSEQAKQNLGTLYELRRQNAKIAGYLETHVPANISELLNRARNRTASERTTDALSELTPDRHPR